MGAKFKEVNEWLKKNRHMPIPEMVKKLNQKLGIYKRYVGVSDEDMARQTLAEGKDDMGEELYA